MYHIFVNPREEYQYLNAIREICEKGVHMDDRTGAPIIISKDIISMISMISMIRIINIIGIIINIVIFGGGGGTG